MKRKTLNGTTYVLVFLAFLLVVTSCRTPAGRTTGEVIDDTTITSKVKAKLLDDPMTKGLSINVTTFEGNVTLTGAVASQEERRRAIELARGVTGVKSVKDTLNIKSR